MKKIVYVPKKIALELKEYVNGYLFWCSSVSFSYKKVFPKYLKLCNQTRRVELVDYLDTNVLKFYALFKRNQTVSNKNMQSYILSNLNHTFFETTIQFKKLVGLRGVGYKFLIYKNSLFVQVDYSYLLRIGFLPFYYGQFNRKMNWIRFKSNSIALLAHYISVLRNLRCPDVYKGKGIRYAQELYQRKQGKKRSN